MTLDNPDSPVLLVAYLFALFVFLPLAIVALMILVGLAAAWLERRLGE